MQLLKNNNWKREAKDASYFQLPNDEIHIWTASLEKTPERRAEFLPILSSDEQARAKRFYFERDRNHYVAGRAILRILLGNYLGVEPARIEFTYGVYGKPDLETALNGRNLQFNLSHSKDQAIYAFNWDQPVGVDIEYIHPMKNMEEIAAQFFTANECEMIHFSPKDQKYESFFKIWTCKEAYLKANGSGLMVPINQVEIFMTPEGKAGLASIGDDLQQTAPWSLKIFTPITGYQAACAIKDHKKQIVYQQIS